MPTVPRYDQFVKTEPLRLPDAVDAAAPVAQGLARAGDALERMRQEELALLEDAADVRLSAAADALMREFRELRGEDAIRRSVDFEDRFFSAAEEISSSLPATVRSRFTAVQRERNRVAFQREIAQHADREGQQLYDSTFKALYERTLNEAAKAAREGRPDEARALVTEWKGRVAEARVHSRSPWRSDEEADQAEQVTVSALWRAQAEALYADERFSEASALIEAHRDEFTETDLVEVQEGRKRAVQQSRENAALREALAIQDPQQRAAFIAGLKDADGNPDAALQRQVREAVRGQLEAQKDALGEQQYELIRAFDAWSARPENRGLSPEAFFATRPDGLRELEILGGRNLDAMRSQAKAFDDDLQWASFHATMLDPKGREQLRAMDPATAYQRWFSKLSTHRAQAEQWYQLLKEGGNPVAAPGASNRVQGLLSTEARTAAVAERFGLKLTAAQEKTASTARKQAFAERFSQFQRAADEAVRAQGETLNPTQLQDLLEALAYTQVRIDTNDNARFRAGQVIDEDLEDEIIYGGPDRIRQLAQDPEVRLRMYVPMVTLQAGFPDPASPAGAALIESAKAKLAEKNVRSYSDFTLMRMAALMLSGDQLAIDDLVQSLRGRR